MSCRAVTLVALSLSFAFALPALAAQPPVEVTACGQEVPPGRSAILMNDLTCALSNGALGVALGRGAKLDMQGHTITGGVASVACLPVMCDGTWCGPMKTSGRCEVSNGTITGARYEGISAGKVVVRNVTFANNRAYAILAFHKAEVRDSQIVGDQTGVQANLRIRLVNTTIDGGYVVSSKRVDLFDSSVTNVGILGIFGRDVRLTNSSVTGNGTDPRCGVDATCADIASTKQPRLDATSTCGHSLDTRDFPYTTPSWGVCTLD